MSQNFRPPPPKLWCNLRTIPKTTWFDIMDAFLKVIFWNFLGHYFFKKFIISFLKILTAIFLKITVIFGKKKFCYVSIKIFCCVLKKFDHYFLKKIWPLFYEIYRPLFFQNFMTNIIRFYIFEIFTRGFKIKRSVTNHPVLLVLLYKSFPPKFIKKYCRFTASARIIAAFKINPEKLSPLQTKLNI